MTRTAFCSFCAREGDREVVAPDERADGKPACIDDLGACAARADAMDARGQALAKAKGLRTYARSFRDSIMATWRKLSPFTKAAHTKHGVRGRQDRPAKPRLLGALVKTKTVRLLHAEQMLLQMPRRGKPGWCGKMRRGLAALRERASDNGMAWASVKGLRLRRTSGFLQKPRARG